MKKIPLLLLLIFLWSRQFSQCPDNNTLSFGSPTDLTPPSIGATSTNVQVWASEYVTVNVVNGANYTFKTCIGNSYNTALTLYKETGGSLLKGYNDDFCGTQSQINWTSDFTGVLRVLLDDMPGCNGGGTNTRIDVTLNSAPAPCITPSLSLVSFSNVSCNGLANGSATVSALGGAPFTYSWSPSGGVNNIALNLSPNVYTCIATNSCGLIASKTVTITQPNNALATSTAVLNVLCNGASTGAATVTANGGTSPYSYFWSSAQTTSVITNLLVGAKTVTVTDANGCKSFESISITEPQVLQTSAFFVPIACYGNTTNVTVMAIGGTPTYSGTTTYTVAAGVFSYTVTDANGCLTSTSITISQPPLLNANTNYTNALCFGQTGSAEAIVSGGTIGYSYTWSPSGGNTYNVTNLSVGIHTIDISDANGCSLTQTVEISEPIELQGTLVKVDITCVNNGQAEMNVYGGTPLYTYSWIPSGGTGSVSNVLTQGNYTATATDANGCVLIKTFTILSNTIAPIVSVFGQTAICDGEVAVLTALGANNYIWEPNTINSNSISISPNTTSQYTVLGTSLSNGCSSSSIHTVIVNQLPTISVLTTNSLLCLGETATLSAIGANSYTWSTAETTPNIMINPTIQTTYTVEGIDINGCFSSTILTQNVNICTSMFENMNIKNDITVNPNPTYGEFKITFPTEGTYNILNTTGQVVKILEISNISKSITLSGLSEGLYYIVGNKSKFKLIINK